MGGAFSHLAGCFARRSHKYGDGGLGVQFSEPLDEGLGHSFCYVRPPPLGSPPLATPDRSEEFPALYNGAKLGGPAADEPDVDAAAADLLTSSKEEKEGLQGDRVRAVPLDRPRLSFEKAKNAGKTIKAISGASVSANTATPRSMISCEQFDSFSNFLYDRAAAFQSSSSILHIPLQPVPRGFSGPLSGPLDKVDRGFLSGPLERERGFMSGPLERGFMSGPLERGFMSGPLDPSADRSHYSAPLNGTYHDGGYSRRRRRSFTRFMSGMSGPMKKAFAKTASSLARTTHKSIVAPVKNYILSRDNANDGVGDRDRKWFGARKKGVDPVDPVDPSAEFSFSDGDMRESERLQWAQGKAGEDRVHVVISEERDWVFVGIYDGFNGPDAPDFLMSNLYPAIAQELQGLLGDPKEDEDSYYVKDLEEFEAALDSVIVDDLDGEEVEHVGDEIVSGWRSPSDAGDQQGDGGLIEMVRDPERRRMNTTIGTNGPRLGSDDGGGMCNPEGESNNSCGSCSASSAAGDQDGTETTHRQSGWEDGNAHAELEEQFAHDGEGHMADRWGNGQVDEMENERPSEQQPDFSEASSVSSTDNKGKKKDTSLSAGKQRNGKEGGINKYVRWRCGWDEEDSGVIQKVKNAKVAQDPDCPSKESAIVHASVLSALARALEATENAYLDMADKVLYENPELALMGSCVLVMLMKDEDVYIMNVGDSRAVLAQHPKVEPFSVALGKGGRNGLHGSDAGTRDPLLRLELERIIEETPMELEALEGSHENGGSGQRPPSEPLVLGALQLTTDHSTCVEEEVLRLRAEHPDDDIIENDRVKGKLKVTRAFGAGYLKQPKWNNALLEMFQIKFVGTAPYMTCSPSLHHHRLGPQDEFLVLSSDGLYQYFSNEEVVSQVEQFMKTVPDGDPAQHLIEELLFRAAKKAGMDFHELLDIPQGDRRRYHDDVSVMVISLEGRIWRSSG